MQRIDSATVIPLYSFHTEQLREHLKRVLQVLKYRLPTDGIYVCNYTDFLDGCISTNLYSCCGAPYTPQFFMNARLFLDSYLTSGNIPREYLPYFRKSLRVFAIDTCILTLWLRYCLDTTTICVLPTLPLLLINNTVRDSLLSIEYADLTKVPTQDEWLTLTGSICREFPYAASFPFVEMLSPSNCEKDFYTLYMFRLLQSVHSHDYNVFVLLKEEF